MPTNRLNRNGKANEEEEMETPREFFSLKSAAVSFAAMSVVAISVLVVPQPSDAFGFTHNPGLAHDPGVRGGAPGAGGSIPGLTENQEAFYDQGLDDFAEAEGIGDGLGPRFNLDGCGGCHSYPAVGGSSAPVNPQVAVATAFGARNTVPSFIRADGPVREARFVRKPNGSPDGGVHALFVISGRVDDTGNASDCNIEQEDFETQVNNRNIVFRIPTPLFGLGLIESIDDQTILDNINANAAMKLSFGVRGRVNHVSGDGNNNGNDGTIARTGWKAQNKSGLLFAGEAYNVEMGITNELFQTEREEDRHCQFATVPNDVQNTDAVDAANAHDAALAATSAISNFANFQRFLAPPAPVASFPGASADSIARGRQRFMDVGCNLCHTPTLMTSPNATVAALRNQPANLYSDIAVHGMGPGLADGVNQGEAAGDEFRTAPLWGLGQRIFFLHDGRTSDLRVAINAHKSAGNFQYRASEANTIVDRFSALRENDKQDLFNFLRSL
jgi:CxxC motif-containing protein (DUF1111 family)